MPRVSTGNTSMVLGRYFLTGNLVNQMEAVVLISGTVQATDGMMLAVPIQKDMFVILLVSYYGLVRLFHMSSNFLSSLLILPHLDLYTPCIMCVWYIGGYHEYMGDILSTQKGYHDSCGGFHEFTGGRD